MKAEEFQAWLEDGAPVEADGDELDPTEDSKRRITREWYKLPKSFVREVLDALPDGVADAMRNTGPGVVLAGGFIRAIRAGERPRDVDLFVNEHDKAQELIKRFEPNQGKVYRSDNAFTQKTEGVDFPVQAIFRWSFIRPTQLLSFFDFSIARAAIWHDGKRFTSVATCEFEKDCERKLLRFMHPERPKGLDDLNMSFLRAFKFYGLGYEPPKPPKGEGGNS